MDPYQDFLRKLFRLAGQIWFERVQAEVWEFAEPFYAWLYNLFEHPYEGWDKSLDAFLAEQAAAGRVLSPESRQVVIDHIEAHLASLRGNSIRAPFELEVGDNTTRGSYRGFLPTMIFKIPSHSQMVHGKAAAGEMSPIELDAGDTELDRGVHNAPATAVDMKGSPPDLSPNWNQGFGELHHDFHSIAFWIPKSTTGTTKQLLENSLRDSLSRFAQFNGGHNDIATVSFRSGIAYFNLLGKSGKLSDIINDAEVAVSINVRGDEVIGQTLGGHQLVGQRRWRFTIDNATDQGEPGYAITVETEAYDRPRTQANEIGALAAGTEAQLAIWRAYLRNIADSYTDRYGGYIIDQHATWKFLGYHVRNPWGPPDQFVPDKPLPIDVPPGF